MVEAITPTDRERPLNADRQPEVAVGMLGSDDRYRAPPLARLGEVELADPVHLPPQRAARAVDLDASGKRVPLGDPGRLEHRGGIVVELGAGNEPVVVDVRDPSRLVRA